MKLLCICHPLKNITNLLKPNALKLSLTPLHSLLVSDCCKIPGFSDLPKSN